MERLTERIEGHYIERQERLNGKIVGKQMCLDKLGAYEDAEDYGLLLRLPCKVGDYIYRVNTGAKEPIIKMRVLAVIYKQFYKDRTVIRIDAIDDIDMEEYRYLLEDFGIKVFLTKEEAEKKLKEMESDNNGTME